MTFSRHLRRGSWLFCVAVLCWTTTTGASAQVIRPGGSGNAPASEEQNAQDTLENQAPAAPAFQLFPGYPNPFNPSTQLRFSLDAAVSVRLEVYNLLGQRVRTLMTGWQQAGVYEVRWDAHDARGAELPTGMYLIRLGVGNGVQVQKVIFRK